jgi:hypothetical protein
MIFKNGNTTARLPIPNSGTCIVGRRNEKRLRWMKFNRTNKIIMALKREKFQLTLPIINDDIVGVSPASKKRLRRMEIDATNRLRFGDDVTLEFHGNVIVMDVNSPAVGAVENPGAAGVKGNAFDTDGLKLELDLHGRRLLSILAVALNFSRGI